MSAVGWKGDCICLIMGINEVICEWGNRLIWGMDGVDVSTYVIIAFLRCGHGFKGVWEYVVGTRRRKSANDYVHTSYHSILLNQPAPALPTFHSA